MLTSCVEKTIIIGMSSLCITLISMLTQVSAESAFKAVALAIRQAIERTGGTDVPSTKGVL
ncbi:hypothetical protein EST38_g980 [Candolleomyces aberdarensis]|uniref:Uncharacterized protein n=1 Tax=Candolleomyces aberdarensis TaxID=2316362 RepID=A0A4V1Q5A3_9AGAR|nr:hypothetical protein EST38_g980 [Candolleomyces aberdarensis]